MPFGATAAATLTVSVIGYFASPLISKVLDQYLILKRKEDKELEKGLEKEIECLGNVLGKIKSITEDAEEKQFKNSGVHDWLRLLKDVLYDAEDVLDMYEVDLLLKKQRDTEPPPKKKVSFSLSCLRCCKNSKDGAQPSSRLSVAKEVKLIRERLDEILKQGNGFGLKDLVRSAPQVDPELFKIRETSSYLQDDESAIFGRRDVKEEIVKQLVHPGDDARKFLVLPIVGMGGLGKTTLAQLVFNDREVVAFYKTRAWVCLGQSHYLDPSQTTGKIIESVRSFRRNNNACSFSTLQALHVTLLDEIEEPFLLVLDDAWDTVKEAWDRLLAPLKCSSKKCRVIVTTRNQRVADAFGDNLHIITKLGYLDYTSMLSIFEKSAFGTQKATEFPGLEQIGRQIVQRLKGLPLAAKTIGGILHENRNIQEWIGILKSEQLVNYDHEENFMLSILMLSYHSLPVIMKQYFSCFSLFPKDYEFREYTHRDLHYDDRWLIRRLFLIEARIDSKYSANDCVNGLLNRSLLQYLCDGIRITISMHDLVHDMAELARKDEFHRISDAPREESIPKKVRHISVFQKRFDPGSAILKNLITYKSLRTLIYHNKNERLNDSQGLFNGWFENLRYLQVLSLYNYHVTVLPDSIKNLRLLRYLDLFLPKIKKLPSTISHLTKLQGLNLRGCENLCELPSSITRLVDLIHLDVDVDQELLNKVDGIGNLRNLHELEKFYVEDKEGHAITELEKMNKICGSLSISKLERVKDSENAQQARLDQKTNLESLKLSWNNYEHGELQTNIIEELRPSTVLKELFIIGYRGECLPSWLGSRSSPSSSLICLHHLHVSNCPNLTEIPFLPSTLQHLSLFNTRVKSLVSTLPSLQKLELIKCGELDGSLNVLLRASSSSLKYLKIHEYNCPLEGLSCASNLLELELHDCKEKVILNRTALISLKNMEIKHCLDVVVQGHQSDSEICSSLTSLRIIGSSVLESLLQCRVLLTSLTYLDIVSKCDDSTLSECLYNATSLETLSMGSCPNITSMPSRLMDRLAATKQLHIYSCHRLVELGFPFGVNISITISGCPNLSFRRSSPLVNPVVIKHLDVTDFSGEQLSGLFSISQDTPTQRITLRSCEITDVAATSILGGTCRNTTLEVLEMFDCEGLPSLKLESLKSLEELAITNCSAISSLPVLSSLEILSIEYCPNLAFTFGESSTPLFPSLEILFATKFSNEQLTDLIKGFINSPVKWLTIRECHDMESFDSDLQSALLAFKNSLFRLFIVDCPNLRRLPTHLEAFEALLELQITKCPQMLTLPDGLAPASLQLLQVRDCPALEALHKHGNRWLSSIPQVVFQQEVEDENEEEDEDDASA